MRTLLPLLFLLTGCLQKATPPVAEPTDVSPPEPTPIPYLQGVVEGQHLRYTADVDWFWGANSGISEGVVEYIELPDDTISFATFVESDGDFTGLAQLQVDDALWVDATNYDEVFPAWYTPPFYHYGAMGGGFVAPMDAVLDPAGAQLLTLSAGALQEPEGTGVLHVLVRTGDPSLQAKIDLNIVVVGDAPLYQEDLDASITTVNRIWSAAGGPTVGEVEVYVLEASEILDAADSNALRRTALGPEANLGVTVFFIEDYLESGGTLGEAGGIPGPLGVDGVDGAGVILALAPHQLVSGFVDATLLGSTLAHEVGHQLGLYHTTEATGDRLESLDTPECPSSADTDGDGSYSAAECASWDGANFMFWASANFVQEEISADQTFVLSRSPIAYGVSP